jgi:hypothetical protein
MRLSTFAGSADLRRATDLYPLPEGRGLRRETFVRSAILLALRLKILMPGAQSCARR